MRISKRHIRYIKYVLLGVGSIFIFVFIAQVSQANKELLQGWVLHTGIYAPIVYIFINALSIVIAPLGTGFLIPVAANTFGPVYAALYSILGWFIGSILAFHLSRRYGYGQVSSLKVSQRVKEIEKSVSNKKLYILVTLLRMALPVDVFSYALGLFSNISYKMFIITTLIGITPFAFLFTYASVLPIWTQIMVSIFSLGVFAYALYFISTYKSKN